VGRTHAVERHHPAAVHRLDADRHLASASVEDDVGLLGTSVEDRQPFVFGEAVVASLEELTPSTEEVCCIEPFRDR